MYLKCLYTVQCTYSKECAELLVCMLHPKPCIVYNTNKVMFWYNYCYLREQLIVGNITQVPVALYNMAIGNWTPNMWHSIVIEIDVWL